MLLIDTTASVTSLVSLFPTSAQEIKAVIAREKPSILAAIQEIISLQPQQRTFANTVAAFDFIGSLSNLAILDNIVSLLKEVHPDEDIRQACKEEALALDLFWLDNLGNNKATYRAFKEYADGNGKTESLSKEQAYYVQETLKGLKNAGFDLPDDQFAQLSQLKKDLADLSTAFSMNCAQDASSVVVERSALEGLDDSFIATLEKTGDELYKLGTDYPTYLQVRDYCTVEDTRKRIVAAYNNRAYPANDLVLKEIIEKRDRLAKMVGLNSFADLDLQNKMVKTVARAEQFLHDLLEKSQDKTVQEIADLTRDLPPSVALTADGKIKEWDFGFVTTAYKKKYLAVDEQLIAEYFPMHKTMEGLFSVYKKFFSIDFVPVAVANLWHEDVQLIQVYNKDHTKLHGYIFLDLHPRPNKYNHAAHGGIVPGCLFQGRNIPAVSLVMANFPKATQDKPSLFRRQDVATFFHEFGHALHFMLSETLLAGQAGTRVLRDFVELPSQLLEEWLWDPQILKMVSSHYKTGAPLPDELIDQIIKLRTFDTGTYVSRQGLLALTALAYYKEGAVKDPHAVLRSLSQQYRPYIAWEENNHFYASWVHLTGYAASYYGYLWSYVFALDVFSVIKEQGLLNPEIGKRYVDTILSKGGSADPNELLHNFLGREPNNSAFLKGLGLV